MLNKQFHRDQFPGLHQEVNGKPLVYLDNAATAQRPQVVLDAINDYYVNHNANIHRGVHSLSESATDLYENARKSLAKLLNAPSEKDLIFVRGCTEAVNLVAQTFVRSRVSKGDEILISHLEHHSNIVPWQLLCEQTGAVLKVIPMNDAGELCVDQLDDLLTEKTKFMSVVHVSNALGTINPVKEMVAKAHAKGVPVMLDGAQATPHLKVDVQDLDCDFYTVSGHKMYGPTGSGVDAAKFPKLAGQHSKYIATQLKAFRAGERANDMNQMMRDVAKRMSDTDIEKVAGYIAGLQD